MRPPSVEPIVRSRLMPRISFRTMFLVTTLAAFLAALARIAGGGTSYAIGVLVAVAVVALCFLCFAILFLLAWSVAALWYRGDEQNRGGSPFAADELPPQILPPREPIQ